MANNQYYIPEDSAPLPPKNAEVLTTACDYCIVGCGYKVFRWPLFGPNGGPKASENAFNVDFPTGAMDWWVAPTQHNVVMKDGVPYRVVIVPDKDTKYVNKGDSSIRGGLLAQKCYNPRTPTADRLKEPMIRIHGILQPVSWDFALDIVATLAKHVVDDYGPNAYVAKSYGYQFWENTYALSKFWFGDINTTAWSWHDTSTNVTGVPGFQDAGVEQFSASYEDWGLADTLLMVGCDPWETQTILYTQNIKPGIERGMRVISMNPRETAGVAYPRKLGQGLHLDLYPGTDVLVLGAIARIVIENGWEDKEWIAKWVNNRWETDSGFGRGTRNTQWQWRTTWGKFETGGFEGYKKWLLAQDEYKLENASRLSGVAPEKIRQAAEWLAKPKPDGRRVKASVGCEKGLYWSNNTGGTIAIAALATICGAGGRPGQVLSRFGGHQRGWQGGAGFPTNKSPQKVAGRRRQNLNVDRWLESGQARIAHVVGTTWIQAMAGSAHLERSFEALTVQNPNQVNSYDKQEIIDTLKKRMSSGGTVVINHDIYLRHPIGGRFADIVFPAATWGEEDFARAQGERRIRLYSKIYDAPGNAKPDWWIIAQIAKRMGFDGYDWKDSNEVLEESSRFSRNGVTAYHMIKVAAHREGKTLHQKLRELGTDGIQGPTFYNFETGELHGTKRLHDTAATQAELDKRWGTNGPIAPNRGSKLLTHFGSHTGKVNIQKHPWELFSDYWEWMRPKGEELWATNGRSNEVWQSGFDDTERRAYLAQRNPADAQWLEMHPDDAQARGIESGDLVMVYSDRVPRQKQTILGVTEDEMKFSKLMENGWIDLSKAAFTAVVTVTPAIKKGVVYSNFMNTIQPSNSIAGSVSDNISGNPSYKVAAAKVKKLGESRFKDDLRTYTFAPRNIA